MAIEQAARLTSGRGALRLAGRHQAVIRDQFLAVHARLFARGLRRKAAQQRHQRLDVDVGFVGATESKDALARDGRVPFAIIKGRKGGSAMAAAAVNALASEAE